MTNYATDCSAAPLPRTQVRSKAAFLLLAILFATATLHAEEASTIPEQVLTDLRSANDLRTALETQRADWEAEKSRLELLMKLLQTETQRHQQEAERARAESAKIRKESENMTSAIDAYRMLQAAEKIVAGQLQEALDQRQPEALPGVIPLGVGDDKDPAGPLSAALSRLADTETAAKEISVEVVQGMLGKEELAVRMLRAGAVAAWWISLDGNRAGTAHQQDGILYLTETTSPEERVRIQSAFAVQAGQSVPAWLLLPVTQTPANAAEGVR